MTENRILDFIARLCLVLIFPFSTLDKIFNHQSAMAQAGHGLIALPEPMLYVALDCGLVLKPGEVAIALSVSDWLTVTVADPANGVEDVEAGALMA